MACPRCGEKVEMEYVQGIEGGYDVWVYIWCTKCDFEAYEN